MSRRPALPRRDNAPGAPLPLSPGHEPGPNPVEARYLGKLGFKLIARYGRVGDPSRSRPSPASPWEKLERDGFKLRLTEVQRGSLNVVLQPGLWRVPRVDHLGVVMDDEDDFPNSVILRAMS